MSATAVMRRRAPALAPRGFAWRAFGNEAGKGLRLMWRHRAVTITGIVLNGFLYLEDY
jgi:hypothetical protein